MKNKRYSDAKIMGSRGVSIALACRTFSISESCYRYECKLSDENAEIADWLEKLTDNRRTWGFGLCFLYLRNVKGFGWNITRQGMFTCPRGAQARLPDLLRTGTEPADKAEETPET
jgi:putative transposase